MIGKFENEEALLKSYGDLEKEFTKKCQELSKVKKELEEVKKPLIEDDVDTLESADDLTLEAIGDDATAVGEVVKEQEVAEPHEIIESVEEAGEKIEIEENLVAEEGVEKFDKLDFRAKANEFLLNNSDARAYSKEIAKLLMKDKSLLSCSDPFQVAYALVLKERNERGKIETPKPVSEENFKDEITDTREKTRDIVSLLGRKTASAKPLRVVQKFRTMDDARAELLRRFS